MATSDERNRQEFTDFAYPARKVSALSRDFHLVEPCSSIVEPMQEAPPTQSRLLRRLQDPEDHLAWEEFVEIYSPVIRRVARRRGLQAADAENMLQEVLLAVSQALGEWLDRSDRGRFRAWLLRIAHYKAVDLLTRRATRPLGDDGSNAQKAIAAIPDSGNLTSLLEQEYRRAVFRWAAEQVRTQVASQTWDAFRLTLVEGLSAQQAANRIGVRLANIYFSRSRVMSRIKKLVDQYEDQT